LHDTPFLSRREEKKPYTVLATQDCVGKKERGEGQEVGWWEVPLPWKDQVRQWKRGDRHHFALECEKLVAQSFIKRGNEKDTGGGKTRSELKQGQ